MCPICRKSIIDPLLIEATLDAEIEATKMPEEYKNLEIQVLCNDCNTKSTVKFHVVGAKCLQCRSYNTSQVKKD